MARFRILRRPSAILPDTTVYDVQERTLWWWSTVSSSWLSLENAEESIEAIKKMEKTDSRPQVVKECD
jgi:hypothetical protein